MRLTLLTLQVRVWNIPEQRVVDWADVHEMVTATAFAPDGRRAVVGTMKGRCRFYQCEPSFKLEYQAQIGARQEFPEMALSWGLLPWSNRSPSRCAVVASLAPGHRATAVLG